MRRPSVAQAPPPARFDGPLAQPPRAPDQQPAGQPAPQPDAPGLGSPLPRSAETVSAGRIRRSAAFRELSAGEQQQVGALLDRLEAAGATTELAALQEILRSEFFTHATPEQRRLLINVLSHLPVGALDTASRSQGRGVTHPMAALAEMVARPLDGNPMLDSRATDGTTLLAQLSRMADRLDTLPPDSPLLQQNGTTPQELLGHHVLELNDSGRIAQENVGTCAATTAQIILLEQRPAEYTRVVTDLLVDGRAVLADGREMPVVPSSIGPHPGSHRTPGERIFQSALMDLANGDAVYEIATRSDWDQADDFLKVLIVVLSFFLAGLVALLVLVCRRHTHEPSWGLRTYESASGMQSLLGGAVSSANWGAGSEDADHYLQQLQARHPDGDFSRDQVLVSMQFSPDGMHADHAVQLTRMDPPGTDPRTVQMHNPWGSEPNAHPGDPVRGAPEGTQWVDPERGIISMPFDVFRARTFGFAAPGPAVPHAPGANEFWSPPHNPFGAQS